MTLRFPLLVLAAACAATAVPAAACSVISSYRVPTALELAERAETIVLGTVERQEGEGRSLFDTNVVVRPTLLLKGAALPAEVRLGGHIAQGGELVTRSDPHELHRPNPDALRGGCNRYVYEQGMQLVLILVRDEKGELRPTLPPFARAAEDVPSADALWVKAVRLYAEAAPLSPKRRRSFLLARRDALLAAGDADSLLLARDINRQLKKKRLPPSD